MAIYKSDYETFLQEMRGKHPEWEGEQRRGMALLWNKKIDFAEQKVWSEATDKPHSYPYDVNFA